MVRFGFLASVCRLMQAASVRIRSNPACGRSDSGSSRTPAIILSLISSSLRVLYSHFSARQYKSWIKVSTGSLGFCDGLQNSHWGQFWIRRRKRLLLLCLTFWRCHPHSPLLNKEMFQPVLGLICFEYQKRSDSAHMSAWFWLFPPWNLLGSGREFTSFIGELTGGRGFSTAGASPGWSSILFYGVRGVESAATI